MVKTITDPDTETNIPAYFYHIFKCVGDIYLYLFNFCFTEKAFL